MEKKNRSPIGGVSGTGKSKKGGRLLAEIPAICSVGEGEEGMEGRRLA